MTIFAVYIGKPIKAIIIDDHGIIIITWVEQEPLLNLYTHYKPLHRPYDTQHQPRAYFLGGIRFIYRYTRIIVINICISGYAV